MSIKSNILKALNFILHGRPQQVHAKISYLLPHNRLIGKKVIITGGGRGLGFAMAKKFVEEGAEVLIAGRNINTLQASAEKIGCRYLALDVSEPTGLKTFISEAARLMGGINVLVNNAGISLHEKSFFDVTSETFDNQINTNLKGAFFLTQEFVRYLKANEINGNVLFISSETGDTMDYRPYGFTKVAVNSMVQGLAFLFKKEGIRVNAIAPGVTASDMTGFKADGDLFAGEYATGRIYLPEEVAETACFLISDVSGCISGQIITCNNAQTVNARWK